jgi:hypothetical protein
LQKAGADMVVPDFTDIRLEVLRPLFARTVVK